MYTLFFFFCRFSGAVRAFDLTSFGGGRLGAFFLLDLLTRESDEKFEVLEPLWPPPDEAPLDDPLVGAILYCEKKLGGWLSRSWNALGWCDAVTNVQY